MVFCWYFVSAKLLEDTFKDETAHPTEDAFSHLNTQRAHKAASGLKGSLASLLHQLDAAKCRAALFGAAVQTGSLRTALYVAAS